MASTTPNTAAGILDSFYAAERIYMSAPPEKRDFSGMAAVISPNHKLYQSADLPYGGVYDGHEGFLKWAKEMADRFDVVDVREPRVFERPGDEVIVYGKLHLRVRRTGEELDYPFIQAVKVDLEKGTITEIRPFYWDVANLNAALARE